MSEGPPVDNGRALRRLIVHDLRGPLAIVLGQCDLMELRGDLTKADAASVDAIRSAAGRVLSIVDEAGDLLPPRSSS